MAKSKDYFGLPWIVSVILAIFPITSAICGILTRFSEGKIIAGLIRLFVGWNIWWILDLLYMIFKGSIFRLLKC